MDDNIINVGNSTIIVNGGNPLEGCPKDWVEARKIEKALNNDPDFDRNEQVLDKPVWSFDCGFKLDYDGPLLTIGSRFYPPKTHYGSSWNGTVTVYLMNEQLAEKKFDCPTLEELKQQVDAYVQSITNKLKATIIKEA